MLNEAYEYLWQAYGPQHWWPAETPWEVMVGAVLTQNTSWTNVEKAIANLRQDDLLDLRQMAKLHVEELAECIRPAGYYRLKAKRLKNLVTLILDQYGGDLENLLASSTSELRETLLSVNGIGPETADSIVLYAAKLPVFVVDTYTARVLKRHGWIYPEADYYEIQDEFHRQLPTDEKLFNEYHALLVRVGKEFCRPQPRCDECPLRGLLPEGGPAGQE